MTTPEIHPKRSFVDPLGAFVAHAPYGDYALGSGTGPLAGARLAVKDLFDVAGLRTGAGSPAWLDEAVPAAESAEVVTALIEAGAEFVGKTVTDELAWSLNGENIHYGTPVNPRAPGRIPGGSSAGSAAAVAGELADLALGTDTGGSVRLPASYCGLYGMRPTHGRLPLSRTVPLAPSYDTVGWFARRPALLARAGSCLFGRATADGHGFVHAALARDTFERVDPNCREPLIDAARRITALFDGDDDVDAAPSGDLARARSVFRLVQSSEVWATHGAWVTQADPDFGPGIRERFRIAAELEPAEVEAAREERSVLADHLRGLLDDDRFLILPGAAAPPPVCGLTGPALEDMRARALEILGPVGNAGLPCVTIPAIRTPDGPVGLSLVGPPHSDERLLALACALDDFFANHGDISFA